MTWRALLARDGFALRSAPADLAASAGADPWNAAATLLAAVPRMVERQPIRAVPGGRSFASTRVATPLHTDSQVFRGAPPDAQVMICVHPAADGGAMVLVDGWRLLERLAVEDARLLSALFTVRRRMRFIFGDVTAPTAALAGGALALTCSPIATDSDPVGARLAAALAAETPILLHPRAGDVVVVDNRRMLHGRTAFHDPVRAFVRLLVWLDAPLGRHAAFEARASAAGGGAWRSAASPPMLEEGTAAIAGAAPSDDEAARRLRVVTAMLRGVPPGVLAAREAIPEPELYRWREGCWSDALAAVRARAPGQPLPESTGNWP